MRLRMPRGCPAKGLGAARCALPAHNHAALCIPLACMCPIAYSSLDYCGWRYHSQVPSLRAPSHLFQRYSISTNVLARPQRSHASPAARLLRRRLRCRPCGSALLGNPAGPGSSALHGTCSASAPGLCACRRSMPWARFADMRGAGMRLQRVWRAHALPYLSPGDNGPG